MSRDKIPPADRAAALRRYHRARRCGNTKRAAVRSAGVSVTTLERWLIEEQDAPRVAIAKARRCLRCRTDFRSSWPGERICRTCKSRGHDHDGLPAAFAETPTEKVSD